MQIFFTLLGIILSLASTSIYILTIFQGKTKPHLYTHIVWSIVTFIAFFGSLTAGGGIGAWIIGVTGFTSGIIVLLSFKYGTKDIKPVDALFLFAALVSIIPWVIFKDPFWSVILAVAIDMCGYFPTMRKTWKTPSSEVVSAWAIGSVKALVAIIALSNFNIITVLFPAEYFIMNSIVAYIIVSRRNQKVARL